MHSHFFVLIFWRGGAGRNLKLKIGFSYFCFDFFILSFISQDAA